MLAQQGTGTRFARNSILRSLSPSDYASLLPYLERVSYRERVLLQEARKPIEHVHFIETGLGSLRILASGDVLETAIVGCRGATGISIALGVERSIYQCVSIVSGTSLRIRAADFCRLMLDRPKIREQTLRYAQALMANCSQTALCGVHHDIEQRLASWLCQYRGALRKALSESSSPSAPV